MCPSYVYYRYPVISIIAEQTPIRVFVLENWPTIGESIAFAKRLVGEMLKDEYTVEQCDIDSKTAKRRDINGYDDLLRIGYTIIERKSSYTRGDNGANGNATDRYPLIYLQRNAKVTKMRLRLTKVIIFYC